MLSEDMSMSERNEINSETTRCQRCDELIPLHNSVCHDCREIMLYDLGEPEERNDQ